MNKITEEYLIKNGYEKKQTTSHTDIFWKEVGIVKIYIHSGEKNGLWNLGLFQSSNDINIKDFKFKEELSMLESLLVN